MILPTPGAETLVRVFDTASVPAQHLVEGMRVSGWKLLINEVDVTTAVDGGWRQLLSGAGIRSLEVRLSGLCLGSDGERLLREAAFAGTAITARIDLDAEQQLQGRFIVLELGIESKVSEEATYEAVLRSAGELLLG